MVLPLFFYMKRLFIFLFLILVSGSAIAQTEHDSIIWFNVKGVSFKMIFVEGGSFVMGCTSCESGDCENDEKPAFAVTLSSYYIGECEVTQDLWKAVTGNNPSKYKSSLRPVENVTWFECQKFVEKLSKLTGRTFSIPTEAQWEYAARGGKKSQHYRYSGSNNIDDVAWYEGNSLKQSHVIGQKMPNELGLYDMSGNVQEWCADYYDTYTISPKTNPTGPETGYHRVYRGGAWYFNAWNCRPESRRLNSPKYKFRYLGLRVVMTD